VVQQKKFEMIIDELNEKNVYHQKKLQGLDEVLKTTTADLAKDKAALKKLTMEHEDLLEVRDWLKKENEKIPEMEKEIKDLSQFKEHHQHLSNKLRIHVGIQAVPEVMEAQNQNTIKTTILASG